MACINQTKKSFIINFCEFSLYNKNEDNSNKLILEYLVHKTEGLLLYHFRAAAKGHSSTHVYFYNMRDMYRRCSYHI